jgi:hypothetical protein
MTLSLEEKENAKTLQAEVISLFIQVSAVPGQPRSASHFKILDA